MSTRQPSDPKAPQAAWMNRADVKFPTDLCATVHWIVALQNKYEQVKTFVPVAPSALSKATSDAKVTVQKIQSVMKQATESLVELYQELDKKVKHVEVQTFKTEGWYKSALVLDELFQQREEFRAALNEIRNPEAYSSYLHTQFVKANKRELFSRGSLRSFMQASCEEIRRVQSMPGGRSFAFRLWIQLKMDLALPKGQAIGDTFLFGYRSIINNAINELIQRPFEDGAHLNFAWAARAVSRVMEKDKLCKRTRNVSPGACIHDPCYKILDALFKRAYNEIRISTIRAVGRKLPQELVDLVFDHTLAVERIPLDPGVLILRLRSEVRLSRPPAEDSASTSESEDWSEEEDSIPLLFPKIRFFCPLSAICRDGIRIRELGKSRSDMGVNRDGLPYPLEDRRTIRRPLPPRTAI